MLLERLEKNLNLVYEMNRNDTDNVAPMSHPLNLKQELRKDEVNEINQRELFQKDNVNTENGYYKVPKIID